MTQAEIRFSKLSEIGCIICRLKLKVFTPTCIHHLRTDEFGKKLGKSQRSPYYRTIPLCPIHHQIGDGTEKYKGEIAYHKSPNKFEEQYWTENYLLEVTNLVLEST
jgi:hypothetical protein